MRFMMTKLKLTSDLRIEKWHNKLSVSFKNNSKHCEPVFSAHSLLSLCIPKRCFFQLMLTTE